MKTTRSVAWIIFAYVALVATSYSEELIIPTSSPDEIKMDFVPNTDGHYLYFSRYDKTGNTKEFIKYDPLTKTIATVISGLGTGTIRYLWSDDISVVIHDTNKRLIIVHDSTTHADKLRLTTDGMVTGGWLKNKKLYVVRNGEYGKATIYDADSGKELLYRAVAKSVVANPWGKGAVLVGDKSVYLYDDDFNPAGSIEVPYKIRFNSHCDRGPSLINGDRLYLIANCGELYAIDLSGKKIEHSFGYLSECMFPTVSVGGKLLVVGNRNGDDSTCEIKFLNLSDNSLLATLPLKPAAALVRDKKLILSFYESWSKPTRIEIYQLASNILDGNKYYESTLKAAHQQAITTYRNDGDAYRALVILERANPSQLLNDKTLLEKDVRATVLNDYGFFLSLTLDRYREAVAILQKVADEFPERTVVHLNLSDVYWKMFLFSKNDSFQKKASSAYAKYKLLMQQTHNGKVALRKYDTYQPIFDLSKQLRPIKLEYNDGLGASIFSENDIYVPSYTPGAGGPAVAVLNRTTFERKTTLTFLHDDQFQDNVSSIVPCKGKIFISTGFRYEDRTRPSLYVFDKANHQEIGRFAFSSNGLGSAFCFNNFLYVGSGSDGNQAQYREIDPDKVKETGKFFTSGLPGFSYPRQTDSSLVKQYLLGEKQLKAKGIFNIRSESFIQTVDIPSYPVHYFNLYNLESGAQIEDIPALDGATHISSFIALPSADKVLNLELTRVRNRIVVYDLKRRSGKTLFQERYIGPMVVYDRYLIFGLSRSLIFYDLRTDEVVDVLTGVTGQEPEVRTDNLDAQKIISLVVDRDRLLIGTHGALYSKVLDLLPVKKKYLQ